MISLIPPQFRLLAAALALAAIAAAGFSGGYKLRGMQADAAVAKLKQDHAEQVTAAVKAGQERLQAVLDEERTLRATAERIADEARQRTAHAQAVAADLAGQSDRLRNDIRRYSAARACPAGAAAGPAGGGLAGTAAGLVPGDERDKLLDEAAEALRILAPALDAARSSHAACAELYTQARDRLRRVGATGREMP